MGAVMRCSDSSTAGSKFTASMESRFSKILRRCTVCRFWEGWEIVIKRCVECLHTRLLKDAGSGMLKFISLCVIGCTKRSVRACSARRCMGEVLAP